MPKISVIAPIYKVEPYLRRCVDSILAQTFKDFEVILVDDGSPDGCPAICDEYAEKDSRVRVIHKENGGLSSARNAGIDWVSENSDSEWLCLIDSDDAIHPCYLEYLYRAALENNVKISVCDVYMTKEADYEPKNADYSVSTMSGMGFYMTNNDWATIAVNKLYARDIFENYRYPVGRIHEDEFLTYKLLYRAKTVAWVDAQLYTYYRRDDSIMGKYSIRRLDGIDAVKEQGDFFKGIDKSLYIDRRITLIVLYVKHLKIIRTMPEHRKTYLSRRKEFRSVLRKNKKTLGIGIIKTPTFYDEAYPTFMKLYWAVRGTLGKVKRGLARIFGFASRKR